MKVDKYTKDVFKRLDGFSSLPATAGNFNNNNNNNEIHDDEYYLDIGEEPPRFAYYKRVRWEKLDEHRKKRIEHGNDIDDITQDELDFILKRELRIPPEQRYQEGKENIIFHELYYLDQKKVEDDKAEFEGQFIDVVKEYGCGYNLKGCVPECRFYAEYGRIEDQEVIEEHNKLVEWYRQRNAIVEIKYIPV
jgi:hypothetical protein